MIGWSLSNRSLTMRVVVKVVIVLATIEVVFLAEKLTGILEQVLGSGGDVVAALSILVLTAPEIFDFALALACVIGGYFAFVAAREEREMVALSAAGVSPALPLRVALVLGVCAFGASLGVSGFIDPLAKNLTRSVVFTLKSDLLFRRITEPSEGTLIETIRGKTFAALSDTSMSPPHESLFVHQPGEDGSWRVTQAGKWRLDGPDAEGNYSLGLGRVIAYDFVRVSPEDRVGGILRGGRGANLFSLGDPQLKDVPVLPRVKVENVSVPVSLTNILHHAARTTVAREWTFLEALDPASARTQAGQDAREIAGERFARAIAAFLAPLLALLACAFASGGLAGYFAMPLACAGLLALDVGLRALLGGIAGAQPLAMAAMGVAIGLALALALTLAIGLRSAALLRPVSERA
ncbi:LptF/LptG family permease [Stappia stellulata]|uniref:LptF/LptG family permease n=1 Tax=Stappia stellulata TaxID=71235 RepID=UPI0003FA52D3|nr:LptF/LptG family permease [Stappia stellulata]